MNASRGTRPCLLAIAALAGMGMAANSLSRESASVHYRLIAPAPASVAAVTQSPVYTAYVVGGSGQPAGISASPGHSVVIGGASNQLPTDRIFRDGMEEPPLTP